MTQTQCLLCAKYYEIKFRKMKKTVMVSNKESVWNWRTFENNIQASADSIGTFVNIENIF